MKINPNPKVYRLVYELNGKTEHGVWHFKGFYKKSKCNQSLFCSPKFNARLEESTLAEVDEICPRCLDLISFLRSDDG